MNTVDHFVLMIERILASLIQHKTYSYISLFQHEYMSYMEKKTNKRQTTIISLSDQNQKEIHDIKEETRIMLEEYEAKKAGQYTFCLFISFSMIGLERTLQACCTNPNT